MQTNILQYLEETVHRVPDKTAFSSEYGALTFYEVYTQARTVGTRMIQDGYHRKPVAVFMKKHPKTIAAFLGVIYSGCFYVPLDEEMPRHRIEMILQSLDFPACICDDDTYAIAAGLCTVGRIYRYEDIVQGSIDVGALQSVREHQIDTDPIYVVFTSGSTGVPKGVVGCHRAVIDYIDNLCDVLKFNENTVFGNQTPLFYDACLKEIMPTLKYGAVTHLIPRKLFLLPVKLVEYLNEKRINTLCWVVSALTFISSFKTFEIVKPEYLCTIAFASEIFPIRHLNIWRNALPGVRFINLYGPTETTGICCYYEVDREFADDEILPVGRPFRNTQIILLDENDTVPEPGKQGEICIRGTRLTHGYYGDPCKTAESFVQNPLNPYYPELIYRTGDIGLLNERGELVFVTRSDNQIKHMGRRIELGEIEAVSNSLHGMGAVCCIYDPEKKRIVLYYTGAPAEWELKAHLTDKMPRYMMPHTICRLETMPLTPNGKIDRKYLKQRSKENG